MYSCGFLYSLNAMASSIELLIKLFAGSLVSNSVKLPWESKSTARTFLLSLENKEDMIPVVVVFDTPPFCKPNVIIFVMFSTSFFKCIIEYNILLLNKYMLIINCLHLCIHKCL